MQSEQLKELEKLAASDSPCPKDLDLPETMLFYIQDDYKQFCDICKRYQELIKEGYSHDNLNNNNVSLQELH